MNVTILHLQRSLFAVLIFIFGLIIGHQANFNQTALLSMSVYELEFLKILLHGVNEKVIEGGMII